MNSPECQSADIRKVCYLNTDLELVSKSDLTPLVSVLEEKGLCVLHCAQYDNLWYATLEAEGQYEEPEATIAEMLTVIESLDEFSRAIWDGCVKREFDIGYECGQIPKQLKQTLSEEVLKRMTVHNASLCITLYPAFSS
ncbi:MAG: hypothetical protein AAFY17_13815 [Cyanobacteria bacterium J06642_11]